MNRTARKNETTLPTRRELFAFAGLGFLGAAGLFDSVANAADNTKTNAAQPAHDAMSSLPDMKMTGNEVIGMVLYPGFTALDLIGPHFFFGGMMGAKLHLITTERTLAPVPSDLGLAIAPTVTLADAPKDIDLLFVGGGSRGTRDAMLRNDVVDFLADRGSRAQYVTSVCTGSLLLGQAGFLKGKRATSHWATRELLPLFGATSVDARVVVDDNVITGAGVTAGLDFAITVVSALRGKGYAQGLMLQAEYHPEPPLPGGTIQSTDPQVAKMMREMFAPSVSGFREAARKI